METGDDNETSLHCCWCGEGNVPIDALLCPHCRRGIGDILPPGTVLRYGRYRLERALGKGGFGITYAAQDTEFERRVAIKEFFPSLYARRDRTTGTLIVGTEDVPDLETGLEIFRREGRMLAQVVHPGVPVVHDRFDENGTAYLVMEFLEGCNLRAEMQKNRLPENRVHQITGDLVSALSAVHAKDICHLDIKPDNVIIQPDGRVVLIDFGAARQGSSFGTRSVAPLTPQYAPLELMTRDTYGPESDLFELGMMLYEMLTGKQALRSEYRQVGQSWEPIELSAPWRTLVTEATRLNRSERPSDIRAWWAGALLPTLHSADTLPAPAVSSVAIVSPSAFALRSRSFPILALLGTGIGLTAIIGLTLRSEKPSVESHSALLSPSLQATSPISRVVPAIIATTPTIGPTPSPAPSPPLLSEADRNAQTRELRAALERFARAQNSQIEPLLTKIMAIIQRGANVNTADSAGITSLHLAAALGRQDLTRLLLERGAHLNQADRDGLTPLHMAALGGSIEVARLLRDAGARTDAEDKAGKTPIALARETDHSEVAQALESVVPSP